MQQRIVVRDHIPLEQGLRPIKVNASSKVDQVRDHIPLEQGLRRKSSDSISNSIVVRDHIPLEQGLRQNTLGLLPSRQKSETIFH